MCFRGFQKLIFTMYLKSLCTVIPHLNVLEAIECFLNKRTLMEPATTTLIRLEELLISLNNFSFYRKHYQQISRVVMRNNMGPSYSDCLLVMLNNKYLNKTRDLFLIHFWDILGIYHYGKKYYIPHGTHFWDIPFIAG